MQIAINLARKDGVPANILNAVIRNQPETLPNGLQLVLRFARTIASGQDDVELREQLRTLYGDEALSEMAIAIATSRLIPTVKRALGHAQSCSVINLAVA